jgi:hypothetical protein
MDESPGRIEMRRAVERNRRQPYMRSSRTPDQNCYASTLPAKRFYTTKTQSRHPAGEEKYRFFCCSADPIFLYRESAWMALTLRRLASWLDR